MLLQLSQAGIGVDDLIRMKGVLQGGGGDTPVKDDPDVPSVAVPGMFARSDAEPAASPAEAMKAMFAKRAAQEETPPPPANPADAMKAMFAKRAGAADPPPAPPANPADALKAHFASRSGSVISASAVSFADAEKEAPADDDAPPANPADAMKAMFARRQTAPAIPALSDVADTGEADSTDADPARPKSTPASGIEAVAAVGSDDASGGVPLNKDPEFAK
jgi:hypothetical protein